MSRIPGLGWKPALLAGALALGLAACARVAVLPLAPRLVLRMSPPSPAELGPGSFVRVTARPEPRAALAWVSGTVGILGAPVVAFRRAKDGSWRFRTMVPPFLTVPPGTYRVKAWGRTMDGRKVHGETTYEVE